MTLNPCFISRLAPAAARRLLGLLACSALALGLTGCTANYAEPPRRSVPPEVLQSSLKFQKEYLLTVGDQLEVVVWRVPEASRVVVVRSDGNISLPLVQDVQALGLTPRELAAKITEGLAGRLLSPQVSVLPQNVRQPMVYVLGDVNAPAAYPLRGATSALQALALAGGVRRSGSEQDVSLIRLSAEGHLQAIPVLTHNLEGQPAPYMHLASMALQPDDIVFVPEGGRSQVSRFLDDIVLKPLQTVLTFRLINSQ